MQRAERAGDGASVVPAWLSVEVVAWPAWGPVPLTIAAGYPDGEEREHERTDGADAARAAIRDD
jgi:hypothetical protein